MRFWTRFPSLLMFLAVCGLAMPAAAQQVYPDSSCFTCQYRRVNFGPLPKITARCAHPADGDWGDGVNCYTTIHNDGGGYMTGQCSFSGGACLYIEVSGGGNSDGYDPFDDGDWWVSLSPDRPTLRGPVPSRRATSLLRLASKDYTTTPSPANLAFCF